MRKHHVLWAAVLAFVAAVGVGGAAAQERKKKVKPVGTTAVSDGVTTKKAGEKVERTRTVVVNGQQRTVKSVIVLPNRDWVIGMTGWYDNEGYNIESLVDVTVGANTFPSALKSAKTQINGKNLTVMLEPGDVISKVEGSTVTTPEDLLIAVQTAPNPRSLNVEWIDWRTGNVMAGTLNAIKLKP